MLTTSKSGRNRGQRHNRYLDTPKGMVKHANSKAQRRESARLTR